MGFRRVFEIVPLLTVPVLIYVIAASVGAGSRGADVFVRELEGGSIQVTLPSDAVWWLSGGDLIVLLAIVMLFVELVRGTGASRYAILHHTAAVFLFLACLGLFLIADPFATTTWFLLMVLSGLDMIGGVLVHMASQSAGGGGGGHDPDDDY